MSGTPLIFLDNLRRRLDAAALSAAITATTWEDRILGKSETISLPVRCVWVATGNNVAVSNEMARRTVRIRLDAKQDRPWERTGFRHKDIRRWAVEHRGEIVGAIIKMVTRWLDKGRPLPDASLGGFEAWSDVVGGILKANGIQGFLENSKEFYDVSDEDTVAWRALIEAWWKQYKSEPIGTSKLWLLITSDSIDIDLGTGKEHAQKVNLGRLLRERRDRQFGELRLTNVGEKKRTQQYKLEQVK